MNRAEHLAALVGVTAEDIAADLDTAATPEAYWEALHAALLRVSWPGMTDTPTVRPILTRVQGARVRCGLTTSEATRTAAAREAEERLIRHREAKHALHA